MKNLVIVESPTKARTLSGILGKDFEITASMGHVRDLPRGEFGVDVENDFVPKYVIPKEKIKAVNAMVKVAAGAEKLWLATDPDREGEAIAWNLLKVISEKGKVNNPDYQRVVFHEITSEAILDSFKNPRKIDGDLVEAQQARRVLDRLVGYKLSPLLWKKVKSGLSAGRVQSVALRLVVDREREIEAFKSQEYWIVDATFETHKKETFVASLIKIGKEKADIANGTSAEKIVNNLKEAKFTVVDVKAKDSKKYPNPPFTTSTLQQTAATRLGFTPSRTMRVAQSLYEEGLITYMRTDSVNLAPAAVEATRKYIDTTFGKNYLPVSPRKYKARSRLAQEAHEAIRPTKITVVSSQLSVQSADQKKLYDLIWKRMVVCQMAEAIVAETVVDIEATNFTSEVSKEATSHTSEVGPDQKYLFRANGQKVKFDGWYKVYEKLPIKEQILPQLDLGQKVNLVDVVPTQKFTEPPPRYTEATLIKELEKNDIGRPSTYAPIISTLYDRNYIEKLEAKKIGPTPIGKTTVDFLVKYFPNIVDSTFTAGMENDLDLIAEGKEKMAPVISKFWIEFEPQVNKVLEEAEKMKVEVETTDEICEKCGKPMVVRYGRFGKFLACGGFPVCKNTKPLVTEDTGKCPTCTIGDVIMRRTKKGRPFWGCSRYPECKFASWKKPNSDKGNEKEQLAAS